MPNKCTNGANNQTSTLANTRSRAGSNNNSESNITLSLEDINSKLDTMFNTLSRQIEAVKSDLSNQIATSASDCNNKIIDVEKKMINFTTQLSADVDSIRKEYELIINGIPRFDNENLQKIFADLSTNFGYVQDVKDTSNVLMLLPNVEIFRFKSTNKNNNGPGVLIRFESIYKKNVYFQKYLRVSKTLNLNKIAGFNGNSRVFIQHNLPEEYYRVHKLAMAFKKDNKIQNTKIVHGRVAVQLRDDERFNFFFCTTSLEAAVNI